MTGTLFIIATPLGNLEDLSPRAVRCLQEAAVIYAEDTRHTRNLLRHIGATTKLRSSHAHNEHGRIEEMMSSLSCGEQIALVSDAGTPAISDPGAVLVAAAHEAGHRVSPIAGPSAMAAALSVAGFTAGANDVWFVGFVPSKGKAKQQALEAIAEHVGIVVMYEAPHRTASTLRDLALRQPSRMACVCRELTKMHEEVHRAPLCELVDWAQLGVRGEVTLTLAAFEAPPKKADPKNLDAAMERCLKAGLSARDTAAAVAAIFEEPKRMVYQRCQKLTQS